MMNEPTTSMLRRWMRSTDPRMSRPDIIADFCPISGRPSGVTASNPTNKPMHPAEAASSRSSSSSAMLIVV